MTSSSSSSICVEGKGVEWQVVLIHNMHVLHGSDHSSSAISQINVVSYLVMVTVEQGHERGLSTRGSLYTSELEIIASTLKVTKIPKQFLDPKSSTLSNCNELSRLKVSETKSRHITILCSKLGENINDTSELAQQDIITVTKDDQITII